MISGEERSQLFIAFIASPLWGHSHLKIPIYLHSKNKIIYPLPKLDGRFIGLEVLLPNS